MFGIYRFATPRFNNNTPKLFFSGVLNVTINPVVFNSIGDYIYVIFVFESIMSIIEKQAGELIVVEKQAEELMVVETVSSSIYAGDTKDL